MPDITPSKGNRGRKEEKKRRGDEKKRRGDEEKRREELRWCDVVYSDVLGVRFGGRHGDIWVKNDIWAHLAAWVATL